MLVSTKRLLKSAKKRHRAIPAFNVSSLESISAVFSAAGKLHSPVIIETSQGECEYLQPELLVVICRKLAKIHAVDYVLHLDRASDFTLMERCLRAGYNSISAEFAKAGLAERLKLSVKARKLTNNYNAALEGVMDIVPLRYYRDKMQHKLLLTDAAAAGEFVKTVKPDSLVVSIGSQSGKFKTLNPLNIDVLKRVNLMLPEIPLVLHGGSYLSAEIIKQARQNGITKINVNSELRMAYTNTLKANIQNNPDEYAPYRLLAGVSTAIAGVAASKINLFSL